MKDLIERLEARAAHIGRRADILRNFADQQADAGYQATADGDADGDEQFAADLRQAALALRSTLPDGGWRPIETAPRKGTFLAAIDHGGQYTVVEATRIGAGVRATREDSSVAWAPGRKSAFWKPMPIFPNPPGEKGSETSQSLPSDRRADALSVGRDAEPAGEEFLDFKEALDDLRSLRAEHRDLNGGGPGWNARWEAAWAKANDLFANEDEAAWCRQQEDAHG